jgi:hypothetical protein
VHPVARPKAKSPRGKQIPVRVNPLEERYLQNGAAREPTGRSPLSTWLRGLGMKRAAELTGHTYQEFEDKEKKGNGGRK